MTSSIADALIRAGSRPGLAAERADKKNYAQRFSEQLAILFASRLRQWFPGILPDESGRGQESRARTARGFKKLDVNYSTTELGLGLGLSIKTIGAPDPQTGRYTKNYTRIDAELRAEAVDYHKRQPFAVMVALLFLPADACMDARARGEDPSSFGAAVRLFRFRAGRHDYRDDLDLFERVFIGLYETGDAQFGAVSFFDVMARPPKAGLPRPENLLSLDDIVEAIRVTYDARNKPKFEWDDSR